MQALIVDNRPERLDRTLIAMMEAGLHATGTASVVVAESCLSYLKVDLLIAEKDTLGDALGDLIGMGEEQNASMVTVLRTHDVVADLNHLPDHFDSLHCIVDSALPVASVRALGLASLGLEMIERPQVSFLTGARKPLPVKTMRPTAPPTSNAQLADEGARLHLVHSA